MNKNFAGQNLNGCSFRGQDLRSADFSGCQLKSCDFTGADLTDANFCRATLGVDRRRNVLKGVTTFLLGAISGFVTWVSTRLLVYGSYETLEAIFSVIGIRDEVFMLPITFVLMSVIALLGLSVGAIAGAGAGAGVLVLALASTEADLGGTGVMGGGAFLWWDGN